MVRRIVTMQCKTGLEARTIAMLVQKASQFSSKVYFEVGTKNINAKSIMGMMSLHVSSGEQVTIVTEGIDEEAAATEMETYLSEQ